MGNKQTARDNHHETPKRNLKPMKILLLGTTRSGKSTIFKQLMSIQQNGLSRDDCVSSKRNIHHQIIWEMRLLINMAEEFSEDYPGEFGDCKIDTDTYEAAEYIQLLRPDASVTKEIANKIETVWKDKGIRNAWRKRGRWGFPDSSSHFFDEIQRIASPNYIPSEKVCIKTYIFFRIKSLCIVQNFRM